MDVDPTYAEILDRLAPCGLDCHRCVMCSDGVVKRSAAALVAALEGFENMAPRVTARAPALEGYRQFADVLAVFAGASCTGCRGGGSTLPFCAARTCFREQGVDYCFQCREYPCKRNQYPESFEERWRANNDRMREVGVEQYYRESLQQPRYR
jgi:Protein of unknown function (DUF3795)